MITKYILIVWVGMSNSQVLSTQSFDTLSECDSVAKTLENTMDYNGWYRCVPYEFKKENG